MRRFAWMIAGALLASAPLLASADESLKKAKVLYDDMDFEKALVAVAAALRAPDLEPAELVDAYRIQGLSLSASGYAEQSLDAFKKLLSIDPRFMISTDISPKLAAPFYQAMAISREWKPITLAHKPGGDKPRVELISDPMALVKTIRVQERDASGAFKPGASESVPGVGPITLALSPKTEAYYFEALTQHGAVLARTGSKAKPFAVPKKAAPVVAAKTGPRATAGTPKPEPKPAGVDVSSGGYDDEDDAGSAKGAWYTTWWFWTAVGVVVVGTAVGAGVGASAGGGRPDHASYAITVN